VALASFVGTTIEWFDFALYGMASALVFNKLYFPTFDPRVGTLAAFGTFAVGFIARPVGAVIIGHFGDRVGRKAMLVFTLVTMGVATFCIGLLPTYATIGLWGAVGLIVLRFAQGFGVGGEWGGAALMIVERVQSAKRGFWGSWAEAGAPAGLALATAVFSRFARMPESQFLAWGWRVPFLSSLLLVAVGLLIRLRVSESPVFVRIKASRDEARVPILELLRTQPRTVLLVAGMRLGANTTFYMYSVFMLLYGTRVVGFARQTVLDAVTLGATAMLAAVPLFGALSDRVGRRPVFLGGACLLALFAYPLFVLFDTGSSLLATVSLLCAFVINAAMTGTMAAFYSELFSARVRYTGATLGTQIAAMFGGGIAPSVATSLLPYGRGAIAAYMIAAASVTIVSLLVVKETRGRSLDG
jgi:MFS family permease